MTEQIAEIVEQQAPKAPKSKRKAKAKRKQAPAKSKADAPIKGGEFAGVSASQCCAACTPERCVISTVNVCKHPYKTGDAGCGPTTMANREKVRKLIKHQMIDVRG